MLNFPKVLAPVGGSTDVCWLAGLVYAVWQVGTNVEVGVFRTDGTRVAGAVWPCSQGAFPRLSATSGAWYLAYRDVDERICLRRNGDEVWKSPTRAGGNDPVCLNEYWIAWQVEGSNAIMRASLVDLQYPAQPMGIGRPTGLSHLDEIGFVVTVDEARGAITNLTRPCWSWHVVCGEDPAGGVRVIDLNTRREAFLWPLTETFVPRVALNPIDFTQIAVITHGRDGVRLDLITTDDLQNPATQTPDPPLPLGPAFRKLTNEIQTLDAMALFKGSHARDGAHVPLQWPALYSHPWQIHEPETGVYQETKMTAAGPRDAVWTTGEDGSIALSIDRTDGTPKGYRVMNRGEDTLARLWPQILVVGETITRAVDILRLDTGKREAHVWIGRLEGLYDGPAMGDIPAGLYAVVTWDFAHKGFVETSLYRVGYGLVAWREVRETTGEARQFVCTRSAPRVPDPPLDTYADDVPVPPTPIQEPPPVQPPTPPSTPSLPAYVAFSGWKGYVSGRDEQDAVYPWAPHDADVPADQWVPNFAVWAMPELRGWERWRTVVVSTAPLRVAFQSVWGHWLCPEFGGNDRVVQRKAARPGAYETWEAESLGAGWWAFRASTGHYLTMEADGTLNANRPSIGGGWERWKMEPAQPFVLDGEDPTQPQPPPVDGTPQRGVLRHRGRTVFDDTGDRLILETSMFHASTLIEHEPELYADNLLCSREAKIDEWRMGAAINWPDDIQDELPTESRHLEKIVTCIDQQWTAGIRTDLCLFLAQSDIPALATMSMCEDYTRRVCRALRDRQHAFRVTIANEPGDTRVWRLGLDGLRRMRDIVRQELPNVMVGLGAPWHPEALGTCDWTRLSQENGENAMPWFVQGCNHVTPHYQRGRNRRRVARQPWLGYRDSGLVGGSAVAVNEEPEGPMNYYRADGSLFNDNEQDPNVNGMWMTAAWCQGHAITCFHTGAGIGYQRLNRSPAYWRLREMPGIFHVAAAKAVLPGDLPSFRIANWNWSLDQGQLFRRNYEPSDSDGTPATRGHCATNGARFVDHEFSAEREYQLIARARMQFAVWDRRETVFVQTGEHRLGINEAVTLSPCLDRLLIGTLL